MKKLNKKGFTLVELLAVIVLLAILAIIAYTTITGVLSSSKTKAWNANKNNVKKAVQNQIALNDLYGTYTIVCDEDDQVTSKKCSTVYGFDSGTDYKVKVELTGTEYKATITPTEGGNFNGQSPATIENIK